MTNQLTAALQNPANLKRLLHKSPTILNVLLVIACAHSLAIITWMMLPADNGIAKNIQKIPTQTGAASNRQQAFSQLTSAHLFGIASQNSKAAPAQAKETRLNLVLRGVLAAQAPDLASAIIARGKSGKEDIYGIGDKLPGGVLVKEIHAEHVLLERQGKLEILRLTKDKAVGGRAQKSNRLGTTNKGRKPSTPQEALTEIRSNILKNPTSFGEYAVPVVVKENGKQIGYRLQPQKKGDMLATVGLQPNDVITSINGIKLDNPSKSIGALRVLSNANEINVTVKRNGAEVPLSIRLQ